MSARRVPVRMPAPAERRLGPSETPTRSARMGTGYASMPARSESPKSRFCSASSTSVAKAHPHLVVTSITSYGLTGPWAGRLATDGVLTSTGCIAYKAGSPDKSPLFPPAQFADDGTSVTFAYATLAALWQRDSEDGAGAGQVLDCSVNEAIANMGDWSVPNRFISLAAGMTAPDVRSGAGVVWPSIPCADGYVRVVILAPRQWRAMRAWLGEPEYLQDPELDGLPGRLGISEAVINPLIAELFADRTMDDIAAEAQQRGIVCTPLARAADVLANEHFKARGSLIDVELGEGEHGTVRGPIPSGFFELDGDRAGPTEGPHAVGADTDAVFAALGDPRPAPTGDPAPRLPLAGLRFADFGIGGVGVEVGRMLAEYGADVLKVESRSYPDFIRVQTGGEMSPSFASSSRSKRAFAANAKLPDGNRVIKELLAHCDGLVENNSTGVMDQLGLGYKTLHEVNPGIVMISSQLMGSRGPWADFRGYGPSTRAAGGIEMLWNYGDQDEPAGGMSIFPDHLVGRIGALGMIAGLLGRRSGANSAPGSGVHVEIAQVEATLAIVGDLLTKEALEPGSVKATGNRRERGTPWGAFKCADTETSTEEWVAVTCRDDAEWAALVAVMGSPEWAIDPALATAQGRAERVDEVEAGLSAWTAQHGRAEVADLLQAAGVPAGELLTAMESIENEHYLARGFRVDLEQPGVFGDKIVFDGPGFRGSRMPFPVITRAPWVGEHTRDVCRDLLGMESDEVERLISAGALEVTPPAV